MLKILKFQKFFRKAIIFMPAKKRYHILQTQLGNIFKEMAVCIYYFYQWLINKIKVFSLEVLISFKIMYYDTEHNKSNCLLSHPLSEQFYWSVMNESPNCLHCALFMLSALLVLAMLIVRHTKKKSPKLKTSCRCGKIKKLCQGRAELWIGCTALKYSGDWLKVWDICFPFFYCILTETIANQKLESFRSWITYWRTKGNFKLTQATMISIQKGDILSSLFLLYICS